MAEYRVNAFNQEYDLPYLQVFADRNRVEREETFELPAAAKDRFMFEISINTPTDNAVLEQLMFDPKFHNTDQLVAGIGHGIIQYYELNELSVKLQNYIQSSDHLRQYALALWKASHQPHHYGIQLIDVDMAELMQAGASPRGMSFFIRAAKVNAWLQGRQHLLPEDLQAVYGITMRHRLFLSPAYAYRKEELLPQLINGILNHIAAP
jgi:MoxR-like ATPases